MRDPGARAPGYILSPLRGWSCASAPVALIPRPCIRPGFPNQRQSRRDVRVLPGASAPGLATPFNAIAPLGATQRNKQRLRNLKWLSIRLTRLSCLLPVRIVLIEVDFVLGLFLRRRFDQRPHDAEADEQG